MSSRRDILRRLGPGILLAATGVGAGDLATASFAGSHLGTEILWAVLAGAFLKYVLTEGLGRYQLATGQTLMEGVAQRMGRPAAVIFIPYLVLWSFFVGTALISACGVTLHAIFPVFADAQTARAVFAIVTSVVALAMVLVGGFQLFERIMSVCIAVMFVTVLATAALLWPGTGEVLSGLVIPRIPDAGGSGITWTIALLGGVGGTVTMLCYGYWIREKGLEGREELGMMRLDVGVGYLMTAIFGIGMVIIGSTLQVDGEGSRLLVQLSAALGDAAGPVARWLFLLGAFGAVFSSVLGVWQSVPYIFADLWRLFLSDPSAAASAVDTGSIPYRAYLFGLAFVPMLGLFMSFQQAQKLYAVTGALVIPLLAVALLVMNGRRKWVGDMANRWPTVLVLIGSLIFFLAMGFANGAG